MSATASTPDYSPGDKVPVSDGTVTVKAVTADTVKYHHPDRGKSYRISASSFARYANA